LTTPQQVQTQEAGEERENTRGRERKTDPNTETEAARCSARKRIPPDRYVPRRGSRNAYHCPTARQHRPPSHLCPARVRAAASPCPQRKLDTPALRCIPGMTSAITGRCALRTNERESSEEAAPPAHTLVRASSVGTSRRARNVPAAAARAQRHSARA